MDRPLKQGLADSLIVALIVLAAIGLPLLLATLHTDFISHTYPVSDEPFELLGFSGTLALLALGALHLRRIRPLTLQQALPTITVVLVGCHYLGLICEYSIESWDYGCYEEAAKAILAGHNPYGSCYLYPPLTAEAMALMAQAIHGTLAALPIHLRQDPVAIWYLVFYLYQCAQWMLILVAYLLCYALARGVGISPLAASILVPALFIVDNPLIRTLRHVQLNLWILDLSLGAILVNDDHPWLSGLLVAVGGHLKLYPLALVAPWAAGRRWRAVLAAASGAIAILVLQTRGGRDWTLWNEFRASSSSFPTFHVFRDNSLRGLITNSFRLLGGSSPAIGRMATVVLVGCMLAVVFGFWRRFIRRERAFRAANAAPGSGSEESARPDRVRWYGHSMDALAFTLIGAPVVWEHVYVLAIPIVIWAVGTHRRDRPVAIAAGAFLMLAVPTFDIFPLSYHRLAGLLLVLYGTPD